jgi:hypothetical protein
MVALILVHGFLMSQMTSIPYATVSPFTQPALNSSGRNRAQAHNDSAKRTLLFIESQNILKHDTVVIVAVFVIMAPAAASLSSSPASTDACASGVTRTSRDMPLQAVKTAKHYGRAICPWFSVYDVRISLSFALILKR